jgi:N-acetylglutamate synthase-like GNAT family acetyltransferase
MTYSLRPATQEDFPAIRALVRAARINPLGLDWRRFLLAVDERGALIGCGQVKTHGDGSRELASIAVQPAWRGQGVARAIIQRLLEVHSRPLYLNCRSSLGPFYEKFGFRTIPESEMPPYFRRIKRLARSAHKIGLMPIDLLVMMLDH